MIDDLTLESFLLRNRISQDTWKEASIEWESLIAIGLDYQRYGPQLREYAAMLARVVQQYDGVHSVRWRIKDSEHMLEKIVRKRAANADKYLAINVHNYYSIITDLIGIRALHLFKNEALDIDTAIREHQQLIDTEQPLVYTRKGDTDPEDTFPKDRFEHREHPAGYRSVHYIIQAQPQKRQVYAEVQVRTIFEEGWSEIDHRIRYPNFNSDKMVNIFLAIFNRLAGQADEMGSFVQGLAQASTSTQLELAAAHDEKRKSLEAMDALVAELEQKTEQHALSQSAVAKLKEELSRMRSAAEAAESRAGIFSNDWFENIKRSSEIARNFAGNDIASQAISILGSSFNSSKAIENIESLNSIFNAANIFSHPASIEKLSNVKKTDRKKKPDDEN
ncbi:RelA/SpoT domain-containing protein [Pseudomonas sp. RGB]|uniref:RelA/SpoT domain-containing protein n=1 Tax=Pseudomonas sp. RGB TaxID=2598474 RepID=UPI001194C3B0|nr:hypothetical protein [Pseudomonas sp. RGB]TVT91581.1 hypothetical protein FPT15_07405 [Pseudomonas sp. RGB]